MKKLFFNLLYFISIIILLISIGHLMKYLAINNKQVEQSTDSVRVIIVQKDSTIKQYKIEMNNDIQKAINADDSTTIKQFIELVTE